MEEEPLEQSETEWLFRDLYKYNGKNVELSQQERRERFIKEQKHKRHEITDKHRGLLQLFIDAENISEEVTEDMECDPVKLSTKKRINFELMQSEWFTEIPTDLEENWFVKICPQGFRILLVAQNRTTIGYNQQGRIVLKISSNFPGGGGGGVSSELNGFTILDCIYNKHVKTVFVLDCLFWNSMSMLESEVDFRFSWLKTKYAENPELNKCQKYNFILLDYMPAQRPLIQDHMFTLLPVGNQYLYYDGVVFYHKESHYIFGYTPLVGWLASYMLPEKLQIDVSPENMVKKPKDYVNVETHLEMLRNKKQKKKCKANQPVDVEPEMDMH